MTHVGIFEDAIQMEKLKKRLKDERERRQFAENELALIKGVGNNSPEMKTLKKRVEELMEINKEHQQMNGKLHSELEIEKKNHTLAVEALELEVRLKDKELGRLMKKLQKKSY